MIKSILEPQNGKDALKLHNGKSIPSFKSADGLKILPAA